MIRKAIVAKIMEIDQGAIVILILLGCPMLTVCAVYLIQALKG